MKQKTKLFMREDTEKINTQYTKESLFQPKKNIPRQKIPK